MGKNSKVASTLHTIALYNIPEAIAQTRPTILMLIHILKMYFFRNITIITCKHFINTLDNPWFVGDDIL